MGRKNLFWQYVFIFIHQHNVVKGQAFMTALHKDKLNPVNIYFI